VFKQSRRGKNVGELFKVALSEPLEKHAEGFAADLARQGYAPSVVVIHVRLLAHVSRWLEARGLDASALDEAAGESFLADRHAEGRSMKLRAGSLAPLLEYLRGTGVAPVPGPVLPATPADVLLGRYAGYQASERGLSAKTIARNVSALRPFLAERSRDGVPDLGGLTAREVMDFVVAQSRQRPSAVSHLVTALRSFLRFLHVDGVTAGGLADAVPTAASRKLAGLPKALNAGQVTAMLASCDAGTALGLRDLAILTVLSRLGLRASEVAGLRLEDIDWARGEITVTGKGSKSGRLPLPADVGSVVVAWLQGGRPRCGHREVFLCDRGPHRPMSRGAVTNVTARAARSAGLGTIHAHRLRHTAATAMLEAGGSLAEIGQVLRHDRALTTAIYAKADVTALRTVAMPWPETAA
jgi:site-specific recombinase XerD